jgi:hypothetical protein
MWVGILAQHKHWLCCGLLYQLACDRGGEHPSLSDQRTHCFIDGVNVDAALSKNTQVAPRDATGRFIPGSIVGVSRTTDLITDDPDEQKV